MNPKLLELALKKQRLQFQAQAQRAGMVARLQRIETVLDVADNVRDKLRWPVEHAPLVGVGVLTLLLLKPKLTFRIARRAWLGWLMYRRVRRRVSPVAGLLGRMREAMAARG